MAIGASGLRGYVDDGNTPKVLSYARRSIVVLFRLDGDRTRVATHGPRSDL